LDVWQGVERRAQHPTARELRPSGRVIIWASDGFRAGRERAELVLVDLGNRLDKVGPMLQNCRTTLALVEAS
jgi:hypothetical protein